MRARGRVLGVTSVLGPAGHQFNVEEVALLASIADQVGVAVENARLRRQAEQSAVMEERARLARELHDSVTQLLYSLNLLAGAGDPTADDATLIGGLVLDWASGMTFALDGVDMKMYVVDDAWPSGLYTIDLLTANVTPVPLTPALPNGIGGLAWVIPEPATLALLALGGLLLVRPRRRPR